MEQARLIQVSVPEHVADDLEHSGLGHRRPIERGLSVDLSDVALVIGLGGSIVSILQGPSTLSELTEIVKALRRKGAGEATSLRRPTDEGNGATVLELDSSTADSEIIEFLGAILREAERRSGETNSACEGPDSTS